MPAFLDDVSSFSGTGEKNELGQDLRSFLEDYDPKRYESPCVTADTLVFRHKNNFTTVNNGLKILMVKRKNHPCIGYWALPGGFVEMREDILETAKRELTEETGLTNIPLTQIHAWGEVNRDPRARIITIAYLALIKEELLVKAGDDAADALWMDVNFHLIHVDNSDCLKKETYELNLSNGEKGLKVKGVVEVTTNNSSLLKEKAYKVIHSEGIGFDHARFIAQALLYIEELLKSNV